MADDGFILGDNDKTMFSKSPLKFLETLMSQIRKDCQVIDKTHVVARYWVVSFCTHQIFSLQWKYRGNEPAANIYIYFVISRTALEFLLVFYVRILDISAYIDSV